MNGSEYNPGNPASPKERNKTAKTVPVIVNPRKELETGEGTDPESSHTGVKATMMVSPVSLGPPVPSVLESVVKAVTVPLCNRHVGTVSLITVPVRVVVTTRP